MLFLKIAVVIPSRRASGTATRAAVPARKKVFNIRTQSTGPTGRPVVSDDPRSPVANARSQLA